MNKQFLISLFACSLVATQALAQAEDKKVDSVNSAKQLIRKNSGEKDLPKQVQKEQLNKNPETLTKDSLNSTSTTKRSKSKYGKHRKEGK